MAAAVVRPVRRRRANLQRGRPPGDNSAGRDEPGGDVDTRKRRREGEREG